jgi:hypothetical protein
MVCGNCGAKIADKAIVCYRCGTATALPPAPIRMAVRPPWLLIVALLVVAAVTGWLALGEAAGTARQMVLGLVALVSLVWSGLLVWRSLGR